MEKLLFALKAEMGITDGSCDRICMSPVKSFFISCLFKKYSKCFPSCLASQHNWVLYYFQLQKVVGERGWQAFFFFVACQSIAGKWIKKQMFRMLLAFFTPKGFVYLFYMFNCKSFGKLHNSIVQKENVATYFPTLH